MFSRMHNFLRKHNALNDYPLGFLPGRTILHAILYFTSKVKEAFENSYFASSIILDLSKPFNTLKHDVLLTNFTIV